MSMLFIDPSPQPQPVQAPVQANVPRWEHFAHQADIGIRGYGRTLEEAFVQTALALTAVITEPRCVEAHSAVTLECRAPDQELLLIDWLNALIFEMATRHQLYCGFDVHIHGQHLHATAWGEPLDIDRHQPAVEVKGATFTALRVAEIEPDVWLAQCVVDV